MYKKLPSLLYLNITLKNVIIFKEIIIKDLNSQSKLFKFPKI